jgi:DNA-binding NtrC family response regulator
VDGIAEPPDAWSRPAELGRTDVEQKIRVLLVDDEPIFLGAMSKVLKARGYEVGTTENGLAALEELKIREYDVVVLDQRMPGIDGVTTLARIQLAHPKLPVILLSGHADIATAVEAMNRGAVDYLLKPAKVEELSERIRSALEKKSILEELDR